MQCKCGGATKASKNERKDKGKGLHLVRLTYNECEACGRVGEVSLFLVNAENGRQGLVKKGPPGPHWAEHGF